MEPKARDDSGRLTLLERLDLAMARQLVTRLSDEDSQPHALAQGAVARTTDAERHAWISGLLALRGFRISRNEVGTILGGGIGKFLPQHQEHKLVLGFADTVAQLEERAADGKGPDGWWLIEAFRKVTALIGRFRGNVLRRDQPWDALLRVRYADVADLQSLIDSFHADECFGDDPEVFRNLHPVRQGVRVMWRFARIAPFPDFNLSMAALAFGGHLLAHGYPPLLPATGDRVRLERLVRGPIPLRSLPIEGRLLDQIETARTHQA